MEPVLLIPLLSSQTKILILFVRPGIVQFASLVPIEPISILRVSAPQSATTATLGTDSTEPVFPATEAMTSLTAPVSIPPRILPHLRTPAARPGKITSARNAQQIGCSIPQAPAFLFQIYAKLQTNLEIASPATMATTSTTTEAASFPHRITPSPLTEAARFGTGKMLFASNAHPAGFSTRTGSAFPSTINAEQTIRTVFAHLATEVTISSTAPASFLPPIILPLMMRAARFGTIQTISAQSALITGSSKMVSAHKSHPTAKPLTSPLAPVFPAI